ncbi:MAG TPA: NAD-dependent epimerase/dehydratase family protein, partial [Solirubrobacteraceae bacterium]|nr:NAD-dependent epimerase/dehydratase family protein [Solirubrobacteraceae bacterium]
MRVAVTGATGLIGRRLVSSLRARGDDVTALTRDPERARARLSNPTQAPDSSDRSLGALETMHWDPLRESAPAAALAGRDAVVHLAGENVAQRWSASAKQAILDSRVEGTKQLVWGLTAI